MISAGRALWWTLRFAIRATPLWFIIAILLTVVTGLTLPVQVYLIRVTVAHFETGQSSPVPMPYLIALSSTFGIAAAIGTFSQVGGQHLGRRIAVRAQSDLLGMFQELDVEDVLDSSVRNRMDIVWGTARDRLAVFISGGITLASTAVSSVGVFAVLWSISPLITALVGLASLGPVLTTPYLLRAYRIMLQEAAPADREVSVGAVYIVSSPVFVT